MKTLKDIIFRDIKVNNNDNYLIFNEGGIGKTTQMKSAYLELINSHIHIDKIVPIFIDCKSLNFKSNYPLLSAILKKYCGNDCMESTHRERLEKLICNETPQQDSYKFIIFIDGINECEANKYKALQAINELIKSPNNKIIVSSRINEDELVSKGFKKLKVKEFTDEQIITYLNTKGFNYNGVSIELNRLNPSLLKILRIPMFLKLFVKTYSNKNIFPDIYTTNIVRKADLLQGFLDKILEDKENQHGNKIAPEYLERKFAINLFLPALAFEMSLKSTFAISEKDMTDVIDNKFSYDYFKRLTFSNNRKLIKNIDCNDVLDICKDEFSLITLSNKSYAFHQVWQDFFCAKFYAMCIEYDIIDVFDTTISASVRQFIGEIVKNENGKCECDFEKIIDLEKAEKSPINTLLQLHNLNSSTPLSPLQTYTLIEIMKTSRNNNITADYSNLDLKNVNFYRCELNNSTFNNTKIYYHNFIPQGHKSSVNSVAFSSDGTKIVSGGWDETIRIWDVKTGLQIGEPLTGHTGWVTSVSFSLDGKMIVSAGLDGTIRRWNVGSGLQIGESLTGHSGEVNSLSLSSDGKILVSAGDDGTIRRWNIETGLQIGEPLRGHTGSVNSVVFSPDDKIIVSGGDDGTIRRWNIETGLQIGEPLRGHTKSITSLAFSYDGKNIVSGSLDCTIQKWNLQNEFPNNEFVTLNNSFVKYVSLFPDNKILVCGDSYGYIKICNIDDKLPLLKKIVENTIFDFTSFSFSPISKMMVSGGEIGDIYIWNIENGTIIKKIESHKSGHVETKFSYDGKMLIAADFYDNICMWNTNTGVMIGKINGSILCMKCVDFSKDGTKIVICGLDGFVRIWEIQTCSLICEFFTNNVAHIISVAFSYNGKKVVAASSDRTIYILNIEKYIIEKKFIIENEYSDIKVSFSFDNKKIFARIDDFEIQVWNAEKGTLITKKMIITTKKESSISLKVNNNEIIKVTWNKIYTWNEKNSKCIGRPIVEYKSFEDNISFSPDETTLSYSNDNGDIRLWNLKTGFCAIINETIPVNIIGSDFRNALYNGNYKSEFYNIIYSNGGLVKDEFKPKPIPFEY